VVVNIGVGYAGEPGAHAVGIEMLTAKPKITTA
jgi:hypothetical protein